MKHLDRQKRFALGHPVFDPMKQFLQGHFWFIEADLFAGLTVNLGME